MDHQLLDILACPLCKGKLIFHSKNDELICRFDKIAFPIRNNISIMLVDAARRLDTDEEVL